MSVRAIVAPLLTALIAATLSVSVVGPANAAAAWYAFGNGLNGPAYATAVANNGDIYVGGDFTSAGGVTVNGIAKWNGVTWSALDRGMNGAVRSLAIDFNGALYAGGSFSLAGGVPAQNIAKWDGSTWSAVGSGRDGEVRALAFDGTNVLYAGGDFTGHLARFAAGSWTDYQLDGPVNALAIDPYFDVYVGGSFATAGSVTAHNIVKLLPSTSTFTTLGVSTDEGVEGVVNALAFNGDGAIMRLFVGGLFTKTIASTTSDNVAAWDASTTSWQPLANGLNGSVQALTIGADYNTAYAAGSFTGGVARWDGSWSGLGTGPTGNLNTVASAPSSAGMPVVGGSFSTIDGVSANSVAAFGEPAAPTISALSPDAGSTAGGTELRIEGTNLWGATSVTVGGTPCASFVVDYSIQITCTTPAHAAGYVDVEVTTSAGTATLTSAFTFVEPPVISSVTPSAGPTSGNQTITISGSNLTSTNVYIGNQRCEYTRRISNSTITCSTPPSTAGTVDVSVWTSGGTATATRAYRYVAAPNVTAVTPTQGSDSGGTALTVTGTSFVGVTAVRVGSTPCSSFTVDSETQLTCTSPASTSGTVNVTVTAAGGASTTGIANQYTFVQAPAVTALSPSAGPTTGGTSVVVTGTGFTGATAVTVGGTSCPSYTVNSATQITCTTPAHSAGTAYVVVTTAGGSSSTASANEFTFVGAPTITGVQPSGGPTSGGTSLVIAGTGFTGATAVKVGSVSCTAYTVDSPTQITCTTPAQSAGPVTVTVTTMGGTATSAAQYSYATPPTVTAISPSSGPLGGGTSVTITGTDFTPGSTVSIGGATCTAVAVASPASLTCTTASHSAGGANVVVTTDGGSATLASGFAYAAASPTITGVSPNSGGLGGRATITVTGSEFVVSMTVSLGGSSCTNVQVASATSATCVAPAHLAGAVDVVVTNSAGSATASDAFTFVAGAPTLTAVTPTSGPADGGTQVTLTGSDFTVGMTITFDGVACTNVLVPSSTTAICTTAAQPTGSVTVLVDNGLGVSELPAAFRFDGSTLVEPEVKLLPPPILFGIIPVGGVCPTGWSGPSWQQWPNGGTGGLTCSLHIEWSEALGSYTADPSSVLLVARLWERQMIERQAQLEVDPAR